MLRDETIKVLQDLTTQEKLTVIEAYGDIFHKLLNTEYKISEISIMGRYEELGNDLPNVLLRTFRALGSSILKRIGIVLEETATDNTIYSLLELLFDIKNTDHDIMTSYMNNAVDTETEEGAFYSLLDCSGQAVKDGDIYDIEDKFLDLVDDSLLQLQKQNDTENESKGILDAIKQLDIEIPSPLDVIPVGNLLSNTLLNNIAAYAELVRLEDLPDADCLFYILATSVDSKDDVMTAFAEKIDPLLSPLVINRVSKRIAALTEEYNKWRS